MTARPRRSSRLVLGRACFSGNRVVFPSEEFHRLTRVLRLGPGSIVETTDGEGNEYLVRLEEEDCRGAVIDTARPATESSLCTTLVQAMPKSEKMEYLIQKAVELGVSEIRPVVSRRSVPVVKDLRWQKRQRWEKIVSAAVAQSGRTVLPRLADPENWRDYLSGEVQADVKLICRETAPQLEDVLKPVSALASVIVAVGPEGGWEEEEVALARRKGFVPVSLGPRTLRSETAGIVALSLLQYLFGDMSAGRAS
jgi:16S rRNA (uracil1498-N3)-methyltransferase